MDRGQLRVARDRYWSPRDAASLRTRIITRDEGEEEEIASLDPHLATRRSISLLPARARDWRIIPGRRLGNSRAK